MGVSGQGPLGDRRSWTRSEENFAPWRRECRHSDNHEHHPVKSGPRNSSSSRVVTEDRRCLYPLCIHFRNACCKKWIQSGDKVETCFRFVSTSAEIRRIPSRYCVSGRRAPLDEPRISMRTFPQPGSIQEPMRPARNGTPGGAGIAAGTSLEARCRASQDSCRLHPTFPPGKFLRTIKEDQKSCASTILWPSSRLSSFRVTNFPWSVPDFPI
jgi:hypothetical protein